MTIIKISIGDSSPQKHCKRLFYHVIFKPRRFFLFFIYFIFFILFCEYCEYCGSFWVVVDRFGFVVGRCGSLWVVVDRCGSLWVVLGRCGWFRVLVVTDNKHEAAAKEVSEVDSSNAQLLFTLHIYLTTGVIMCQGIAYESWAVAEFPHLKEKVVSSLESRAEEQEVGC